MSAMSQWTGCEPLHKGGVTLLEASAGTGKTYQIAGLVVRLVAEYAVPIDRILVITFTNAATAELRDRIRRRLTAARDAMTAVDRPEGDPIVAQVWDDVDARSTRRGRLVSALEVFDQASISTIHGFCQRMLRQLAFESRQEPGLELLKNVGAIIEQLIDDTLASLYAEASESELDGLQAMGFERKELTKLAYQMLHAVEPEVVPPVVAVDAPLTQLALAPVRAWATETQAFVDWLNCPEGQAAVAAHEAECASKTRRLKQMSAKKCQQDLAALQAWCDGSRAKAPGIARLTDEKLRPWWKGAEDFSDYGAYPLIERLDALSLRHAELSSEPLRHYASQIRHLVDLELQRRGQLTYSSLISRLADRIAADGGARSPLAGAIRARFDATLIDEFQDTDGAQWLIMRAAFAHPEKRLLLIGDPKQAIYSFRGADVHVYLDAASSADRRATMTTNWRSDAPYVSAMNHLFREGSNAFDLDAVDYVHVQASPRHQSARIRRIPMVAERPGRPFELRLVDGRTIGGDRGHIGRKDTAQSLVARLVAREAAQLLSGDTELLTTDGVGDAMDWRGLLPGDIAVLVRTNDQADLIRRAFEGVGIPSVSTGRGSVYLSPVLEWLCAWLVAVGEPSSGAAVRRLVTTPLFGWTAAELARALERADQPPSEAAERSAWDAWNDALRRWADAWALRGFIGVMEQALEEYEVVHRLLGSPQGERLATDLRHLMELCHAEERRTRLGPLGLAEWLQEARARADDNGEEEALRLESDARAVQIITVHKSKGLEWPVTLVPFAWADTGMSSQPFRKWHGARDGRTGLWMNLDARGSEGQTRADEAAAAEGAQENRRLLYVALTRAAHHCVAWIGPLGSLNKTSYGAALGQVALRVDGEVAAPLDEERALEPLMAASDGTIGWSVEPPLGAVEKPELDRGDTGEMKACPWEPARTLESPWQVSSYTAMVAGRTHDASEPVRPDERRADESAPETGVGADVLLGEPAVGGALDGPIPTAELAGGADVGTWVHAVFEHLDFQTGAGLAGQALPELVEALGRSHGIRQAEQYAVLVDALDGMLDTALSGPGRALSEGWSLRDLPSIDRVDEMAFDLRVGAGNRWSPRCGPSGRLDDRAAAVALRSRLGDQTWGGDAWLRAVLERPERLNRPVLPRIAGMLTGFIDLVFRVGSRYYVADYKTNRIAPPNDRRNTTLGHYTRPWMAWEMAHHGYHLQALLYTVALHRLLKSRLGMAYDYDTHVGGHFYLFVRGMTGEAAHQVDGDSLGVYFDRWPAPLVRGVDAALLGKGTDEVSQILAQRSGGAA